jgi:hypothetical protein
LNLDFDEKNSFWEPLGDPSARVFEVFLKVSHEGVHFLVASSSGLSAEELLLELLDPEPLHS